MKMNTIQRAIENIDILIRQELSYDEVDWNEVYDLRLELIQLIHMKRSI